MKRRLLFAVIPLGLAIPFMLGGRTDEKPELHPPNHIAMERTVGHHLFAPTQLPRGMEPGTNGLRQGAIRILSDYGNGEDMLIVAQERRTPERDAYNRKRFTGRAVEVNGHEGSLTTGSLGERRLAFFTDELTIVLSSTSLSDKELVEVAQSMR